MADAKRDQNSVVTLIGVSSADGITPVVIYVDPITHRLLVQSAGGGGGTPGGSSGQVQYNNAGTSFGGITGATTDGTTLTLVAPVLGAATATSINGVTITPSTGVLTIANAKTLTVSNTMTLQATDTAIIAFGSGGTVAYQGGTLAQFAATTSAQLAGVISDETGSGQLVFATSPTLVTPILGVAAATSINGLTITTTTGTLTMTNGKTLAVTNSLTLSGTDATVMTFPGASDTIMGLGATQTVTALKTFNTGTLTATTPTFTTSMLLSSGFVMNFASSNVVLTHSSGVLTLGTGDFRVTNAGTNTASVITVDGLQTLNNKRVTPKSNTVASSGTPTINTDTTDIFTITALAAAITSFTTNLSGTPTNGQKLIIRILDNGTARAIAWGASFASRGATLPTTTVISKYLYVGFIWNSTAAVWDCVATSQEA